MSQLSRTESKWGWWDPSLRFVPFLRGVNFLGGPWAFLVSLNPADLLPLFLGWLADLLPLSLASPVSVPLSFGPPFPPFFNYPFSLSLSSSSPFQSPPHLQSPSHWDCQFHQEIILVQAHQYNVSQKDQHISLLWLLHPSPTPPDHCTL